MEKAKLITHPSVKNEGDLAEIYQSMSNRYALVVEDEKNEFLRITPYVLCRDFISDVYAFDDVREFNIYGMRNPKVKPDYGHVRMVIKFPNEKSKGNFVENLVSIIHPIELMNNYTQTLLQEVEGEDKLFLVKGSKRWLASYPKLTLYTHLLRIGCYEIKDQKDWVKSFTMTENGGKKRNEDSTLVRSIHPETWEGILTNLSALDLETFCGFDTKGDTYMIHHNSGIYSVFGSHREIDQGAVRKNKHWKHFKEQGTWKLHTN